MNLRFASLLAALGLVLAGCGSSYSPTPNAPTPGPTPTGGSTVTIPSSDGYGTSTFAPVSVTIEAGGTVIWNNRDTVMHNTSSESWSGDIQPNGQYSRTFATRGTFNYRCNIHPGMNGTVVVQ